MALVAFVLPFLPDKVEDHRQFCEELVGARRDEYEASRQRLGITREASWHQETPDGTVSLVCLEANDLGSVARGMGTSSDPFDEWFRERVRDIHGIDLASPAPYPEQVLDYKA
jgi:hypothetical protein